MRLYLIENSLTPSFVFEKGEMNEKLSCSLKFGVGEADGFNRHLNFFEVTLDPDEDISKLHSEKVEFLNSIFLIEEKINE